MSNLVTESLREALARNARLGVFGNVTTTLQLVETGANREKIAAEFSVFGSAKGEWRLRFIPQHGQDHETRRAFLLTRFGRLEDIFAAVRDYMLSIHGFKLHKFSITCQVQRGL